MVSRTLITSSSQTLTEPEAIGLGSNQCNLQERDDMPLLHILIENEVEVVLSCSDRVVPEIKNRARAYLQ